MKYEFEVFVIGGGSSGISAAKTAHGLGKKTAITDMNRLGGECTWSGCVPSKSLIHAAEEAYAASRLVKNKISGQGKNAMEYVRSVINKVYEEENPAVFEKLGIAFIPGKAEFIDRHSVSINGRTYTSKYFIIASGSSPFIPPVEGIDRVPYYTNENLFEMKDVPGSILILGGGPIGVELAQALNRLGTNVTVIEMLERVLFREDPELTEILEKCLRSEGINLLTGAKALKFEDKSGSISLTIQNSRKEIETLKADSVLVAVGRVPETEGLGLGRAGVKYTKQGITVNSYLQTSRPNIYACGDIVGPYNFSHFAGYQGVTAGLNISLPFRQKATTSQILWNTYTDPELSHAGLTEAEARERYGKSIRVYRVPYSRLDRAKTEGREEGLAKYILDKKGRLIGAQIIGRLAGELIHEAQIVRVLKILLVRLQSVMHAYPSYSDIIRLAARDAYLDSVRNNPFVRLISTLFLKREASK